MLVAVVRRPIVGNHSHATQVSRSEFVELQGLGSKANHSCDPICGIRVNDSGAPDLIARRSIAAGDEITFDYAMRNYAIEHFPERCGCSSPICRGSVTGWKDLPEDRRRAYDGSVAPYLLAIEEIEVGPPAAVP